VTCDSFDGVTSPVRHPARALSGATARRALGYFSAVVTVTASTLLAWFVFGEWHLTDVVMVFLLGVVVVSMRFGYGPSLLAAVLSVVSFEFFFIPPLFSFAVADARHIVTFAVMFFVAFVISHLSKRVHDQADAARGRERDTASLYAASREIGLAYSREALLAAAARHAREMFRAGVAVLLPGPNEKLQVVLADDSPAGASGEEVAAAAEWMWQHERTAGDGKVEAATLKRPLLVPLRGSRGRVGVLAFLPTETSSALDAESRALLEAFAALVGSALERTMLADEARAARLRVETEQLRNALLSSVSHDLRTPLGVVTGVTSALLERAPKDEETRRLLLTTAHEEALRLSQLVRNLLDMTRVEAGALSVRKELQPIEEVIGAALTRLEDRLRDREVGTDIPEDLPLAPFDPILIEQVLINLLENAAKYTPPGTPIDVAVALQGRDVRVEVADRGPGVPDGAAERVFDKFYRAREREGGGVGLGLTICRGVVLAHGGRIWVDDRPGGGASFRFTLPLDETKDPDETAAQPPGQGGTW
jgi:two-component system, OmpR family, sensor histidine kinase KdpD